MRAAACFLSRLKWRTFYYGKMYVKNFDRGGPCDVDVAPSEGFLLFALTWFEYQEMLAMQSIVLSMSGDSYLICFLSRCASIGRTSRNQHKTCFD